MGMLPVTLIFVLSASLIVALVYLPVVGEVSGRMGRGFDGAATVLRARLPWILRAALVPVCIYAMFLGAMQTVNPDYLFGLDAASMGAKAALPGALMFLLAAFAASVAMGAAKIHRAAKKVRSGYRRTNFGFLVTLMVANPIMPLVMIFGVFFLSLIHI